MRSPAVTAAPSPRAVTAAVSPYAAVTARTPRPTTAGSPQPAFGGGR
jgi:hypothetical protein